MPGAPYTGQPVKRCEDPKLVRGKGSFVDDVQLPDMLHAAILRSPHAHARIRSIDVAAARAMAGVVTVLTGADIAGVVGDVPTRAMVGGWEVEGIQPVEQPVLARGKVCYVGQPVAIVVARERYLARDAIECLQVDYEPLPPVIDPFAAMQEETTPIHPELGSNVGLRVSHAGGDLTAAFAQADRLIRQRYHVPRLAPVPLETHGVVAAYQPQEDFLTVWNSTQAPHRVRRYVAQLLDRPESRVRVIAADVGGGFGEKGCMFPEDVAIPYLSLLLERPVKWVADRQENMLAFHGRGHTVDVEAAVQYDGTILGMHVRIVADLGAYFLLSTPSVPFLASHRIAGPYKTPAMRVEVVGVLTNKSPTGAYRGAGGPEAAFCMERTLDLIAHDLHLDPVEVRRKNLISPDAFPYTTPTGVTYDSGNYAQGLERVLELADYAYWRAQARQRQGSDAPLIGVGLATVVKASGAYGDYRVDSAQVHITPAGRVINPKLVEGQVYGAMAQGIGQALTESMVYTPEGQPLTTTLLDYAIPRASTVPPLILETMETPSPTNPLGVKGIGELPTVAAPVAVANAILDALSSVGVRHLDTPLTPDKIWHALHNAARPSA